MKLRNSRHQRISKETQKALDTISEWYASNRRVFPWRPPELKKKGDMLDAYKVLVSEIMLQQTQSDRVVSYFIRWMKKYPTIRALAKAPLADVLILWQGLGYNRRAKYLLETARVIVHEHKGLVPKDTHTLVTLPGVGMYTASAISAFAYNNAEAFLETNIRTVLMHFFFKNNAQVAVAELMHRATTFTNSAIDSGWEPREWGYALMDYGAYLKRSGSNHAKRIKGYKVQSPFKGSFREIRGAIIKKLSAKTYTEHELVALLKMKPDNVHKAIASLKKDGLISSARGRYSLPK